MNFVSRTARVVRASGSRVLELRLDGQNCGTCCSAAICSAGRSAPRLHSIAADFPVDPGQQLTLQIDAGLLARLSLWSYLLPAAMTLAGAGFAGWISDFSTDGMAIIGAIAGLVLSGVVLRLYDSRHGFRSWQVEPGPHESGAGTG
jgi:positive regulator of sigma E activity